MTDKITIAAAIKALDPAIDAHWTKAGEPNLNALKEMTGGMVKRVDAVLAAPEGFDRDMAAGAALDATGEVADRRVGPEPTEGHDYIGELDVLFGSLTNDHRVFTEALWRLGQYYKSERLGIQRQIDGSRERGRNV